MAATAKTIVLKGDPSKPESAEHHIIFPGGSISVCRTGDNKYWAHVKVNRETPIDGAGEYESKSGFIEAIRIDTPDGVETVNHKGTDHFAVLIAVSGVQKSEPVTQTKLFA